MQRIKVINSCKILYNLTMFLKVSMALIYINTLTLIYIVIYSLILDVNRLIFSYNHYLISNIV